jgi:serine/threonine protein kinase
VRILLLYVKHSERKARVAMSTNPGYTGRYELQELLGQGGMAEVWKAFDTQTRQYVAIKFLHASLRTDPDFANRFQREAQILASLRHPNIVQYQDFFISQPPGTGNTTASVVMDYVDGGTLGDYIHNTARQGKFLPLPEVINLISSISAALDYAHQHGVVHGQLKPANILLDRRNTARNVMGEPIVTDFGMVRLLATTAGHTSGWWLGTPLYTSPEQIQGQPGDARSDIYALGVMLYEICAGTPPFPGNNPATIMMQHLNTIPASPALMNPSIPPALVTIIMRCIAKDPALRFPSVAAMMTDLLHANGQAGVASSQPMSSSQAEASAELNLPTIMGSEHPTYLTPLSGGASAPALPASVPGISNAGYSPLPGTRHGPISSPGLASAPVPSAALTPQGQPVSSSALFAPGQVFSTGPSVLLSPLSPALPPPSEPPHKKHRRRGLWVTLSVLLLVLVVGGGLGAYLLMTHASSSSNGASSLVAGHAYFVSSGLLSANPDAATVQGITDQLEVRLENVPSLPAGKGYYAWLLNAKTQPWLPLALSPTPLTVNNGTLTFAYPGDAQHTDLLATNSRFVITIGDIATPPLNPDNASLAYYADFSEVQHPFGTEKFSVYDHIRHLLANDPKVAAAGLTGGLDIWLYRNTQKILEWAGSARNADRPGSQNLAFIRRQLTRIIDYLDGDTYTQLHTDLPGQPLLVDPAIARIGLLTFDTVNQNPPGYLYHIEKHLHEVATLPESTPSQRALALQIDQALNAIDAWDHTIRTDVLTLFQMSDAQLTGSQAISLLNEVATLANQAFVGQVDPQGQVTDGVIQVHYAIQNLATFDIRSCTDSGHPCPALS